MKKNRTLETIKFLLGLGEVKEAEEKWKIEREIRESPRVSVSKLAVKLEDIQMRLTRLEANQNWIIRFIWALVLIFVLV